MLLVFVIPALILLSLLASAKPQTATILLAALAPTYLIRFSIIGIPTNLFELGVLVVFSFSVFRQKTRQQWQETFRQTPVWIKSLIFLFVLSSVVSTLISPHPKTSLGILKGWVFIPILIGWLVYAFSFTDNKNSFCANILRSLVLSGLVVSVFGLTQINRMERIRSIYDVNNSLALFITPLLVIASYLALTGHRRSLYLPATIIMAGALIATQSVSGIVTATTVMFTGIVIHFLLKCSLNKTVIISTFFLFFFFIASIYIIAISGRLTYLTQPQNNPSNHNSISVRLQLWDISQELIKNSPLLGIGLGTFEPAYQKALHLRFSKFNDCKTTKTNCIKPIPEFVLRDPHNWPLSFWLNTGLAGLLGFTLINVVAVWKAVAVLKNTPRNTRHALITATILALMSLLLFGLADTIYWKNDLSALHWILIFLLVTVSTNKKTDI